jgi:hypothetical protein
MHAGLAALLQWTRVHPGLTLVAGTILVGATVYANLPPASVPVRPPKVQAPAVPGQGIDRASAEAKLLTAQREVAEMREERKEDRKLLREMQQVQAKSEQERQARDQAQAQKFDAVLKQAEAAQQQARQATTPRPAPKPAAPVKAALPQGPDRVTPPPPAPVARIQILRPDKAASFVGQPPSISRGDTPYLPAGSFAVGKIITGVMATSRAGGALPMLLSVVSPFTAPFQLRGPGRNPRETALPIQGCFILGRAAADLGASRVLMQLDLLSCVFPDQATFEQPIKGYITDQDGTLGVVARVESHDSAHIAKAFLTGLLAGASESFKLAKQQTIVTPLGGTISTQNGQYGETAALGGLANAAAQLSQFYLQQASQLMPTLWVEAGAQVRVVLQEGLALEGFPTSILSQKDVTP